MIQTNHASAKPTIDHDSFFERIDCHRRRRRQLRIGDLMVAVAMIGLGFSATGFPEFTGRERLIMCTIALAFVALQWAQWWLASVPANHSRQAMAVILGVFSSLLALAMFVALIILGLIFPQGAALVSVMILIHVVYLTTWD